MEILKWFYQVPLTNVSWGAAEYGAALKSMLTLGIWGNRDLILLEKTLKEFFNARRIIGFETGRAAMEWILQAAALQPQWGARDEAVFPSFCCRAVWNAVKSRGLKPVLCDVDEDLGLDLNSLKQVYDPKKTLALIVPHLYGRPSPVDQVMDLVKTRDACVIDDAAAAMGGSNGSGRLGTQGHAGVFSFSQGKTATAGGGGALLLPIEGPFCSHFQGDVAPKGAQTFQSLGLFFRFFWFDLLHGVSSPLSRCLNIALARLNYKKGAPVAKTEREQRTMGPVQTAVALEQIRRMQKMADGRLRNMELLKEELKDIPEIRVLPFTDRCAPVRFLIETLDLKMERGASGIKQENPLAAHLRSCGVEAGYAYRPIHLYPDAGGFDPSFLKTSQGLSERLLVLPFLPPLGPGHMARIGKGVRSFFGR